MPLSALNEPLEIALAFLAGYFVAAVPLGLLVVKAVVGIDIRRYVQAVTSGSTSSHEPVRRAFVFCRSGYSPVRTGT